MPAVPIHCHANLPGFVARFIIQPNGSEEPQQMQDREHESASFERG